MRLEPSSNNPLMERQLLTPSEYCNVINYRMVLFEVIYTAVYRIKFKLWKMSFG